MSRTMLHPRVCKSGVCLHGDANCACGCWVSCTVANDGLTPCFIHGLEAPAVQSDTSPSPAAEKHLADDLFQHNGIRFAQTMSR